MTDESQQLKFSQRLGDVVESLANFGSESLPEIAVELASIGKQAEEESATELAFAADTLLQVIETAVTLGEDEEEDLQLELTSFVQERLPRLQSLVADGDVDELKSFVSDIEKQWDTYKELLETHNLHADPWNESAQRETSDTEKLTTNDAPNNSKSSDEDASQIELMLAAISNQPSEPVEETLPETETTQPEPETSQTVEESRAELIHDREMLDAYLDDALRCLSSMEDSALAIEKDPEDKAPIQQFCRELHTLKGASGMVGLSDLARYLHDLESKLETMFKDDSTDFKAEILFEAVDRVRIEIEPFQSRPAPQPVETSCGTTSTSQPPAPREPQLNFGGTNDNGSIRIRAAKLDRLMDMLAELVVLRNRRESHVAEFNEFNAELGRCADRLNLAEEPSDIDTRGQQEFSDGLRRNHGAYSEVAKDIGAVSKGMRQLLKPVSQDNAAISQFIRDFRQELMQLRRIPVSGLFKRLQRAARDAAKIENKKVQVNVVGEHAGLERETQERLFDSLMHVVRNSVSHGIENENERAKAGKNPNGVITLEATSNAQLLVIEVRDDGGGLDYDAIRRRAVEKGLLASNYHPSREELSNLIFHPGFSTRETATELSGRGVGMDVVAKTIESLRGRFEVDSVQGQGTNFRLIIPLRTGIEHVMSFRSGGQLFALPMQSVTAAKALNANIENVSRVSFAKTILRNHSSQSNCEDVLLLRNSSNSKDECGETKRQIALGIDELIGPEEVVVRGLPNLLKDHPLFNGVTLSGSGEKVLVLDTERVLEFCELCSDTEQHEEDESSWDQSYQQDDQKRALVVDDSLTARKVLVKLLQASGFKTVEAGDGIEAIERLLKESFDLILTDLDMPRFGGLELLSDIQSGEYCDAPVVVVSSRDEEVFRSKAMDLGASDYLTKPVSETSITQLLESLQLLHETPTG